MFLITHLFLYAGVYCTRDLGTDHSKSYGGEGNFPAAGIFFRYQIPCMNFFTPKHEYFLGLISVHDFFFHLIFPYANIFLYFAPTPPPPISFLMVRPLIVGGERKGG